MKPGARFYSGVCDTMVVVVRSAADVDLRCGGWPMATTPVGSEDRGAPVDGLAGGSLLGKRYEDQASGLEVLCAKGGAGTLTVGDVPLVVKAPKALPSSD